MGRFVKWKDVHDRYRDIASLGDEKAVDSAWIRPAEFELESKLAIRFTTPFSDNNATAKDIGIDMAYLKMSPTRNKNYERVRDMVDARIKGLLEGEALMITDSGDSMTSTSFKPVSNTTSNNPIFTQPTSCEVEYGTDVLPTSCDLYNY